MSGEHVEANRDYWDGQAAEYAVAGERLWAAPTPVWGCFGLPEAELGMLPADMTGMDAIELGCGTGYVAGWMARRGARVLGVDVSPRQLATARRLAKQHGVEVEFVQGNAEAVDRPDASFDFAISEYGAAIWCDPAVWLPEARRLLRPGGRLVFLGTHPLALVCTPPSGAPSEPVLHRPWSAVARIDWREVEIDPGGIVFNLSHEGWLRLFRETGFVVEDYRELFAPATARGGNPYVPVEWARQWPAEQVWKLVKTG